MDFYDFVRNANEQYGTSDEDWSDIQKSVVLKFDYDDHNNVSSKYKNVIVFRDFQSESTILPGETWICRVVLNSSGKNYFAKAVQRVDASFFFELKKDQIEELANYLWNEQRTVVESILEEKYKEKFVETQQEYIDGQIAESLSKLEEANKKIQELEHTCNQDDQVIASLEAKVKSLESSPHTSTDLIVKQVSSVIPDFSNISVRRVGADSIYSDFFTQSKFFVHVSSDFRMMVIVPSSGGNVICMDGIITIAGLGTISPFNDQYEMTCKYDPAYGGIVIFLK